MLKFLIVIGWAMFLFVCTCTADVKDLLYNQVVFFHWVGHPHFTDLLIVHDVDLTSAFYLIQKIGHFTGFAILALLLFDLTKSRKKAFCLALCYATFTEVIQLYFGRDGRLLDIGIDSLGMILVLVGPRVIERLNKNKARKARHL